MLKKGDLLLILIILFLVASIYLIKYSINSQVSELKAQIIQDNQIIKEVDLSKISKPEKFHIFEDYKETILIENGRIRFEETNCPNKICVKTGWLSKKGDIAVCLPNKTIIKIIGVSSKIDTIAY